ncbi:MAG: methyltransferase domain-containing protein [Acidobacteriota bacterium]|jgi:demethylmenaquinone methyltransferase/2-methoxy-6-polyprenyl-1,4-benzoquinol methylase|nr:methyltransferase domain-containing protein [Acidobacteriota bacterium]
MMHKPHATPEEIDRMRKQFFNDSASAWMDSWYKDAVSGNYDKHRQDFERLFGIVTLKPGDHVLDAGCGVGVLVPEILPRITETGLLYELDFAEKMIEENRKLHDAPNVRFIIADIAEPSQSILPEESCDAVICFSCFPHLHDKEGAMRAMARVLKPGGTLSIAHFISSGEIKHHHAGCHAVMHDHLPHEGEMRAMFERAALDIVTFIDESGFYCVLANK